MAEIQVELAWLSDRATFPYFLEARVRGSNLEVRGYVPNKAVHAQALNLARLSSPLAVFDQIKEHPSLALHPVHRAPEQLQKSVQTALQDAFPSQKFTVHCESNGTVQVAGSVWSLEQKLAVSQALRRLHGCANVVNLTEGGPPSLHPTPVPANAMRTPIPGAMPAAIATPIAAQVPGTAFPSIQLSGSQNSGTEPIHTPSPAVGVPGSAFPNGYSSSAPPPSPAFASPTFSTTPSTALTSTTLPPVSIRPIEVSNARLAIQTLAANTTIEAPAAVFRNGSPISRPKPGEPYESRGVVFLSTEPPTGNMTTPAVSFTPPLTPASSGLAPKAPAATPLVTASQLQKRIETTVPALRQVHVSFISQGEVRIDCTMPPGGDSGAMASQVLALRELDPFKVDLHLQVPGGN